MSAPRWLSVLSALLIAVLVAPAPSAQRTSYTDYAEAAAEARAQDKPLVVYFYSSAENQPSSLEALLAQAEVEEGESASPILASVDLESEAGHALAEALYSRSSLDPADRDSAALVVEQRGGGRGFSLLGRNPALVGSDLWGAFLANALR